MTADQFKPTVWTHESGDFAILWIPRSQTYAVSLISPQGAYYGQTFPTFDEAVEECNRLEHDQAMTLLIDSPRRFFKMEMQ